MKANQDPRRDDDKAEVGIGTMIVFIAAVIVAAIAAAVLVNTAGNLQRTAQETGDETTQEVSGNIFVRDITGHVAAVSGQDRVDDLNVTVSLAPGADPIDLTTMTLRWRDNETLNDLNFQGHADGAGTEGDCDAFSDGFCVLGVKETEGSPDNTLETGDRVHLHIGMDDTDASEPLEVRSEVDIRLIPEGGSPTETGFETPASYNGETFIVLK